jgi:hypothetical protein
MCRLCQKLEEDVPEKIVYDLGDWWGTEKHCYKNLHELHLKGTVTREKESAANVTRL